MRRTYCNKEKKLLQQKEKKLLQQKREESCCKQGRGKNLRSRSRERKGGEEIQIQREEGMRGGSRSRSLRHLPRRNHHRHPHLR
jgi:hypothetical protein